MNRPCAATPLYGRPPVILCNAPVLAPARPTIAKFSPAMLQPHLIRVMSADPVAYERYRAALPPPLFGWRSLPAYRLEERAQYFNPYDSGYYGTPFGEAIEEEARSRDSETLIPRGFLFQEFGDRIVVVMDAKRHPHRSTRRMRRDLAYVYRALADTFEDSGRREG